MSFFSSMKKLNTHYNRNEKDYNILTSGDSLKSIDQMTLYFLMSYYHNITQLIKEEVTNK